MREIKFRAWDKRYRRMDYELQEISIRSEKISMVTTREGGSIYPFDIELMQYTGLHDKNGKEIYEGDILSFEESAPESRTIRGVAEIKNDLGWSFELIGSTLRSNYVPEGSEIIGNIYDNPELLKKL